MEPQEPDSQELPKKSGAQTGVQFAMDEKGNCLLSPRPLFLQLNDLVTQENGNRKWQETSRWIKFEETVEVGGNRWSKPHVGSLSLHHVIELRKMLQKCTICLDLPEKGLDRICDSFLLAVEIDGSITREGSHLVKSMIMTKHKQQYESSGFQRKLPSMTKANDSNPDSFRGNQHFLKKVPKQAETTNILVGELDDLDKPICAFVRLRDSQVFSNMTEIPVPTRFLFVFLGPKLPGYQGDDFYHEIGRAVGCIMSEETFSEHAYKAKTRQDILDGFESLLHELTVLPPGKWDPSIRVEPPSVIPTKRTNMIQNFIKFVIELLTRESLAVCSLIGDEDQEAYQLRKEAGLVRTGRLFGGLIDDIKRKAPFYLSDFTDGFSIQCVSTFFFIYFACLTPIVTFGGLLGDATGNQMAAIESLMSGLVVGVGYGLFAGQPLTIMGSTGPILVFESLIYNICENLEPKWDYLSFRLCIGIWVGILLFIMVAFEASAFVCYITRFTEENFALLIATIFIVKAFEKLYEISLVSPYGVDEDLFNKTCFCDLGNDSLNGIYGTTKDYVKLGWNYSEKAHKSVSHCMVPDAMDNYTFNTESEGYLGVETANCNPVPDVFLMSVLLCFATYAMSTTLKKFKNSTFFPAIVRGYISDFAVLIAIGTMTGIDAYNGLNTPKLTVPDELRPTWSGRGWLIHPLGNNPWWSTLVAVLPACLATILIFMDQQITSVIVNRKENKLKKGCGYHLDLLVVLILIVICSIFGLPWFVAATVLAINHVKSLGRETETSAPGDKPQFLGIREQRVTHILIFITVGLSVFMRKVLGKIPMPVLYGVFLYMGTASLDGLQFYNRILLIFMPKKYQPDYPFLRKVRPERVHLFTMVQVACFGMLWIIKSFNQTSILFPLMLVVMIGVRKLLDYVFTKAELRILDDILPEFNRKQKIALEEELDKQENLDDEDVSNNCKNILVSNPAKNLKCTESAIQVTLENGTIMTIPIKGRINVDVGPIATNSNQKCFGIDEKAVGHQANPRNPNNLGEEVTGSTEEMANLIGTKFDKK